MKIKKIISLLLCLLILFSAVGCGETAPKTAETAEAESEVPKTTTKKKPIEDPWKKPASTTPAATEEKTTAEKEYGPKLDPSTYVKPDDPLTKAKLEALPIANSSMTSDELRQLCVDYVQLSITFQWVANQGFEYFDAHGKTPVFEEGKLYGGIPYISQSGGNLYRILRYYNEETGVLDMTPLISKDIRYLGTACSGTACWGWSRVVNSSALGYTGDLIASNGCIPLGPYQYDHNIKRWGENGDPDARDVAQINGEQTMFESYAKILKADCVVSNGHVRMATDAPVVVRNADGTINGDESYLIQCEQGLFNNGDEYKRTTSTGIEYRVQANPVLKSTFAELFKGGYLPHTFAEFLGTDPVEPGEATLEGAGETVSTVQLRSLMLKANYNISDVFTTVRDAEGNVIYEEEFFMTLHYVRSNKASKCMDIAKVTQAARTPGATIEIRCQIGNGEIVDAYKGNLIVQ